MARVKNPKSALVGKLEGIHLFHFDGAPCAQRVRFALREKGLRRGREVRFDDDSDAACEGQEGAWGSRETLMQGNAVKMAAAEAKRQILEFAAAKLSPNIVYDLDIKDRWIHLIARPERGLPYDETVREVIRAKDGHGWAGGYY